MNGHELLGTYPLGCFHPALVSWVGVVVVAVTGGAKGVETIVVIAHGGV